MEGESAGEEENEHTGDPEHVHTTQRDDLSPCKEYRGKDLHSRVRKNRQLRLVPQRVQESE